jgi:multiple sugar transport system substrate-binding protein
MSRNLHHPARRRLRTALASAVALATAASLAACSSSGGSSPSAAATGKVTLQFWGSANGLDKAVAAWNSSHPNIQVSFTKDTTDAAGFEKLAAAAKAVNAPCVAQFDAQDLVTFASQGLVQDVSQYASQYKSSYSTSAWQAASPGGSAYGLPVEAAPNFFAYQANLFKKYDLTVPTTWDQVIADGIKLRSQNPNLKIMNYAPEDPSGFVGLNWEAGASWYKAKSNGWIIDFTSPQALKAANVLQQLVSNHLLSSVSYTDPGIWKTWDNGTTLAMTTSTWQLPIYSGVFPNSDGNWAITTVPQYAAGEASTDSNFNIAGILKGCANPQQAVEFANWLGADSAALKITTDGATGYPGWFPALADVSNYVDNVVPAKMIPQSNTADIVSKAAAEVNTAWQYGPDYATMYNQMASYWPKVLSGSMTAVQLLQTMQAWTLNDLKGQGINATAGS